jgi:predicted  nucleic acid-binding Zn-ribbon protein
VERNAKISDLHAALAEVTSQRERARTSLERREQDCLEFANQVRALKEQIANQGQTIRDELLPLGSTREALDDLERENGVLRQFIRDFL